MKKSAFIETQLEELSAEAVSAAGLNPYFHWAKFVVTDSDSNLNNQRIPVEEFDNLITTGVFTPLKMDFNRISAGHSSAAKKPLGVITNLKKDTINNRDCVVALAALWERERPEDIQLLQEMVKNGDFPKVSWEISYSYAEDENDIKSLRDVSLNGVTIVKNPAYEDRARFLSMASDESDSEKWTREFINDLPDSAFLYVESGGKKDENGKTVPRSLRHFPYKDSSGKIDENHLRNAIARLEQSATGNGWLSESLKQELLNRARKLLSNVNKKESTMEYDEYVQEIGQLKALVETYEKEKASLEDELKNLREYKEKTEAEKLNLEKIKTIKELFSQKGINKPEEFFEENKELLLSLSDSAIDFMIQELLAFAQKGAKSSTTEIPNINNINGENLDEKTVKFLAENLRNLKKEL